MTKACYITVKDPKWLVNKRRVLRLFINETPNDVLDELSNYVIDGLDFTGTKYERK